MGGVVLIIPAVDLLGGRAVRLTRGRREEATDYGDAVEAARRWAAEGAERLHVVDLDAAFGEPSAANRAALRRILQESGVSVEAAGGLRRPGDVAEVLACGAAFAVVGTAAIEDPEAAARAIAAHPGRVFVAVDSVGGRAAARGWTRASDADAVALARWAQGAGARGVIVTAIERDGTMGGPDLDLLREILDAVSISVVASGGVASVADVEALAGLGGLEGVIVGKALYEGRLDLAAAIRAAA